MTWEAQFAAPGDEPGLLALFREAFGDWPKVEIAVDPLAHLTWKLEGGARGGYRAAIVKQHEEILAGIVLHIRHVLVNGRLVTATTGGDVAVLPAYRSQGLLSAIQKLTLGTFGPTMHMTFGYQSDVPAVAKVAMNPAGQIAGQAVEVLAMNAVSPRITSGSTGTFRYVSEFDERIEEFWEDAARPFDFIPARTKEFLNWRYCDPRAGVFSVETAEENGRVMGYAVSSTSHGRGYLADVLTLPERQDVLTALVERMLVSFAGRGVEVVQCWIPERHPYREALAEIGFEPAKSPMRMMYRPLLATEEELGFLSGEQTAMHFTLGDTDLV